MARIHDVAFEAMARLMESGTNPNSDVREAGDLVTGLNRATEGLHREHGIPRQAIADFVQTWATEMDATEPSPTSATGPAPGAVTPAKGGE